MLYQVSYLDDRIPSDNLLSMTSNMTYDITQKKLPINNGIVRTVYHFSSIILSWKKSNELIIFQPSEKMPRLKIEHKTSDLNYQRSTNWGTCTTPDRHNKLRLSFYNNISSVILSKMELQVTRAKIRLKQVSVSTDMPRAVPYKLDGSRSWRFSNKVYLLAQRSHLDMLRQTLLKTCRYKQ